MMTVANEMKSRNFTLAGGMWGDAYWKEVKSNLVVSIGFAASKDSTFRNDDFLNVSDDLDIPVIVHFYRDLHDSEYSIDIGEAPECESHNSMIFENVIEALDFLDFFKSNLK